MVDAAFLGAVADCLSAGGARPVVRAVEEISDGERRNLLLRCEVAAPGEAARSVVVKQVRGEYDPGDWKKWETRRFFSDWAGAEFVAGLPGEPQAARFLGGDRERGFIVLEDLGKELPAVSDVLLGKSAEAARRALESFVVSLARLHATAARELPRYDAIVARLQQRSVAEPLEYLGQDSAQALGDWLEQRELPRPESSAVLATVMARLEAPGPFRTLAHCDPCPDNVLLTGARAWLIDFEIARPSLALLDAVYVLSPFPTCWCAGTLPESLAFELLERYRVELARGLPAAEDVARFREAVMDAMNGWLVIRLAWQLPAAWEADREWGISTTRARLLCSLRQLGVVSRHLGVPTPLEPFAASLLAALEQRWPDVKPLPTFPAFREPTGTVTEITIRRAVHADLPAALLVLEEVHEQHRQALPWLLRKVEEPDTASDLEAYVSKADHVMFLAVTADGEIAGVLYALLRQPARAPIVRPTTVAELDTLVVAARFRRQGIGAKLVRAALAWATEAGATRTELGVYEFNEAARAFWASVGFETLSRRLVAHSPA